MKHIAVAGLVIVAASAVGGCSSPSAEEAKTAYCSDLQTLADTLIEGQTFTANTPMDSIQQWRDEVGEAVDAVVASADDLDEVNVEQLESSYDEVSSTVESQTDGATIADVYDTLSVAAVALRGEVEAALQTYDCGIVE